MLTACIVVEECCVGLVLLVLLIVQNCIYWTTVYTCVVSNIFDSGADVCSNVTGCDGFVAL